MIGSGSQVPWKFISECWRFLNKHSIINAPGSGSVVRNSTFGVRHSILTSNKEYRIMNDDQIGILLPLRLSVFAVNNSRHLFFNTLF